MFVLCVALLAVAVAAPSKRDAEDGSQGAVDSQEPVDSEQENSESEEHEGCDFHGFQRDATNCSNYRRCVHGLVRVGTCPDKQQWDENQNTCNWAIHVRCVEGQEPEEPCKHEDLLPNPDSCSTFIQCVHGTGYIMPCPAGLHWHQEKRWCDWPHLANCEKSSEEEETTTAASESTEDGSGSEPDPIEPETTLAPESPEETEATPATESPKETEDTPVPESPEETEDTPA